MTACSHCGKDMPREQLAYVSPAACFDCVAGWRRPACPSCSRDKGRGGWGPMLVSPDRERVFATPAEFREHHSKPPTRNR